MTTTVLFDVGSTLLHPSPPIAETFARVASERGHDLTVQDVEPHIPAMDAFYEREYLRDGDFWCSHEGSVAIWLEQYRFLSYALGLEKDAEGLAEGVQAAYRRADHWSLYSDVLPCLRALKEQGASLGVVSNWNADLAFLLRDLRLLPYFDVVVSSAEAGCRKPDPVIFELALKRLGSTADGAVHVGDRPDADGDGSSAAGIRSLIIDRYETQGGCGYRRVRRLTEVVDVLEEHANMRG